MKLDPRDGVAFDGVHIWVANQVANNVTRLTRDGVTTGTFPVETAPAGVVFDERAIWVTNSGSNTVSQLDYTNWLLIGSYTVGNSPAGICFDGNAVWIAKKTSNNLLRR